jgi:YegS/Rv2252/BmrU family lipid kinase
MSRKIIYLYNPISGTENKETLLRLINEKTQAAGIPFEILKTNVQGNYYFLKEKIENEGITDIVVCGGDGSINQVANTLMDSVVNIGIIPMGSGNGLALAAKIPINIDKAIEIILNGKAEYIDAFRINSSFSCMLCGVGFDGQVAHDFAEEKKRGMLTYISQIFGNFIIARPYAFELINKGKSVSTEAFLISVANSNQYGNKFTIAPKASLRDGLLDVIVVNKMNKLQLVWSIIKQVKKGKLSDFDEKNLKGNRILYFQTDKLIIHNLEEAPFHIDGDPAAVGCNAQSICRQCAI